MPTPEEIQAEVDAMVQPLADYLVNCSNRNMPLAHRAGQLLRDASALIVTVASNTEPVLEPLADGTVPEPAKMAPLYAVVRPSNHEKTA
jgi:hypothetical protein